MERAGPAHEPLPRREWQVLGLLCKGARNTSIAQRLGVSPHTVKTHISNIFKKIDVDNRLAAVICARLHNSRNSLKEALGASTDQRSIPRN